MGKQKLSESFGFIGFALSEDEMIWQGKFAKEVNNETVRGSVLNIASFIDELLSNLLKAYFPNENKAENLLSSLDGCLSTIIYKANIASALGLIKDKELDNIKHIARIRNLFAHKWDGLSFDDEDVIKSVRKLNNRVLDQLEYTHKAKFNFVCGQIIQELIQRKYYAENIKKHLPKEYKYLDELSHEERVKLVEQN
ncbi:hypothetical protein [Photobacterium indicum]|uniref:DUF4145 domain-containing protein n=1 Tax=Photobacterium indicum TaxID=81447 RepID=A0A2T3LER5_9GAMM|nr:hypothetical protein [Photobacterium indicum]PSV49856.1 hypothetical protein C9J47_04710 [Photobacterium indicum]